MTPTVAVLALQGGFAEHEQSLRAAGAETFQIRSSVDLNRPFDALVLPGGESTVQGRLLHRLGLFEPLRLRILAGLPVMATCAGLILLAEHLADDPVRWFALLGVTVRRNAYGRQLGSFRTYGSFADLTNVGMTFIRAPSIESCAPGVEPLAYCEGRVTAVRSGRLLAMAFHPELGDDSRIHAWFLREIVAPYRRFA